MRIDKVAIVFENVDEYKASVRIETDPKPSEDEDIEDTPAVLLAANVWQLVQDYLDQQPSPMALN